MAEIGQVIKTKLTAHAGLSALISTRVHPLQLPQQPSLPALTYRMVSLTPVATRDNSGKAGLERPRFQFDCWASTYGGAQAVAQQLREALTTFPQASDPRIDVALVANALDDYEPDTDRWRVILDAFIWHAES